MKPDAVPAAVSPGWEFNLPGCQGAQSCIVWPAYKHCKRLHQPCRGVLPASLEEELGRPTSLAALVPIISVVLVLV